jgi:hypothetical protein
MKMSEIPTVKIFENGKSKFVVAELKDQQTDDVKAVVRTYEKGLFDWLNKEKFPDLNIVGVGWICGDITVDLTKKNIKITLRGTTDVFKNGAGFVFTKALLQVKYPDFVIEEE